MSTTDTLPVSTRVIVTGTVDINFAGQTLGAIDIDGAALGTVTATFKHDPALRRVRIDGLHACRSNGAEAVGPRNYTVHVDQLAEFTGTNPYAHEATVWFKGTTIAAEPRTTRGKGIVVSYDPVADTYVIARGSLYFPKGDAIRCAAADVTDQAPERTNRKTGQTIRKQRDQLPRIIAFREMTDAGEYGAATCPHCGADGRYVWTFDTVDGPRGAMSGCLKLFPVSAIAEEHRKIIERQADRRRTGGHLASWDQAKLDAIEAFAAGTMTEGDTLEVIRAENRRRSAWLERRHGQR